MQAKHATLIPMEVLQPLLSSGGGGVIKSKLSNLLDELGEVRVMLGKHEEWLDSPPPHF